MFFPRLRVGHALGVEGRADDGHFRAEGVLRFVEPSFRRGLKRSSASSSTASGSTVIGSQRGWRHKTVRKRNAEKHAGFRACGEAMVQNMV